MKKILISLISALISFNISAFAETFESFGDQYHLSEDLRVLEKVEGDFFGLAGKVIVTEDVEEDLFLAGGEILISGDVEGDVRLAGSDVRIEGQIEEDLIVFADTLEISPEAEIKGNLLIFAQTVNLDGKIDSDLKAYVGRINIFASISGNAELTVEEKLWIDEKAEIGGNFSYMAKEKVILPENIIAGTVTFTALELDNVLLDIIDNLISVWISFLLVGFVFIYLAPKLLYKVGQTMNQSFLKTFAYGFLTFIVLLLASLILIISGFGLPLGFILLSTFIIVLISSEVFAAIAIASNFLKLGSKKAPKKFNFFLLFSLSFLVINLIQALLLYFYWPASQVLTLTLLFWGLGGIYQLKREVFTSIS